MKKQYCRGDFRLSPQIQVDDLCRDSGKKKLAFSDAEELSAHLRRALGTNHHHYKCRNCHKFHVGSSLRRPRSHSNHRASVNRREVWGGGHV